MEKPSITPICCGQDAEWIVQSLNLAYFFCRECKKEVITPEKLELKEEGNGPRVTPSESVHAVLKTIYKELYDENVTDATQGIKSGVALFGIPSNGSYTVPTSGLYRFDGSVVGDGYTRKLQDDMIKFGNGIVKLNWDSECKDETIRPYEWWYGKSAVEDNIFLRTPTLPDNYPDEDESVRYTDSWHGQSLVEQCVALSPDDDREDEEDACGGDIVEQGSYEFSNTSYAFTETYTLQELLGGDWHLMGKEGTNRAGQSVFGKKPFLLNILYCLEEKALHDWLTNLPTKKNNTEAL